MGAASADAKRRPSRACKEHGLSKAAMAAGFIASVVVFLWSFALYRQYSPVYMPIVCVNNAKEFGKLSLEDGKITEAAKLSMTCTNPNGYDVVLDSSTVKGEVIVWPEQEVLGHVGLEKLELPRHGKGNLTLDLQIELNLTYGLELILKNTSQVLLELDVTGEAKMGLLLPGVVYPYGIKAAQVCGLEIAFSSLIDIGTGPAVCAPTTEKLLAKGIPGVDSPAKSRFSIKLPPHVKHQAATVRDSVLISLMVISGLLTVGLFAFMMFKVQGPCEGESSSARSVKRADGTGDGDIEDQRATCAEAHDGASASDDQLGVADSERGGQEAANPGAEARATESAGGIGLPASATSLGHLLGGDIENQRAARADADADADASGSNALAGADPRKVESVRVCI
jgi:hypothetical protein